MPVLDLLLPFSESALPAPINLSFFCANDEIVSISHATNSEVLDIGKFLIKSGYLQINLGVDLFPSFWMQKQSIFMIWKYNKTN